MRGHRQDARAAGRRRAWLLWMCASVTALACGGETPAPKVADVAVGTDGAPACPAAQVQPDGTCCPGVRLRPDGACCPPGRAQLDLECRPVGPPECAAAVTGESAGCTPRWCADWLDGTGKACDPSVPGCLPAGRECTPAELESGAGCDAGQWPAPGLGCVAAGLPEQAVAAGGAAELPVQAPQGVPAVAPLSALQDTSFCLDPVSGRPVPCVDPAAGCGVGRMPDPAKAGACLPVGVPWTCPPGFVVGGATAPGGLPACVADPADCGDDPFGVAEGPGVVFVDAAAPSGGDGSRAKPLRTIAQGLAKAPQAGTVAVAAGTYAEQVVLDKEVAVRGRCAAKVVLVAPSNKAAVKVLGGDGGTSLLRGVHISGGGQAFQVSAPRPAQLERAWVSGIGGAGVLVSGKGVQAAIREVYMEEITPGVGGDGNGAMAQFGGRLTLTDVRVRRAMAAAVVALHAGSRVVATRVMVDDVLANPSKAQGCGILVQEGGLAELQSVRISRATAAGLIVRDAGSSAAVSGLVVDGTRESSSIALLGSGILVNGGARVTAWGARVSGNYAFGIGIRDPGTTADLYGVLVDGTLPSSGDGAYGNGLLVGAGAKAVVDSMRITASHDVGLIVTGKGSRLEAQHLLVDSTFARPGSGKGGNGILVGQAGLALLRRVRVHDNRMIGLGIIQPGSLVHGTELLVDGTREQDDGKVGGDGVSVFDGALLTLTASRITGNRGVGLVAQFKGSGARIAGCRIDGTRSAVEPRGFGIGAQTGAGAQMVLDGSRVTRNRFIGVLAWSTDTVLRVTGTRIDHTQAGEGDDPMGSGAAAVADVATFELTACAILTSLGVGVLADHAPVKLRGCSLFDTRFATYPKLDADGKHTGESVGLADGILATHAPQVAISRCVVGGSDRAGIMLDHVGKAAVESTAVTGAHYGLVTLGGGVVNQKDLALWDNVQNNGSPEGLFVPKPPAVFQSPTLQESTPP